MKGRIYIYISIAIIAIRPAICQRLENKPNFTKEIRSIMCKLIDKEEPSDYSDEIGPSATKIKRRCYICPRIKDKKIVLCIYLARKLFASHIL